MATLIDGKKISQDILEELKQTIAQKKLTPKLAIVLVGEEPASVTYVKQKKKRGEEIGVVVEVIKFPEGVEEREVVEAIEKTNQDNSFQGLIIQLPLPQHLDKNHLLSLIVPKKDVDGLGSKSPFKGATPLGVLELLKRSQVEVQGRKVVVMGHSDLVGKPVSEMLRQEGGELEVVDINTPNPETLIKEAEILVVAIGQPQFVKKEMVKAGVVVIDVGTNRTETGLVGDVAPSVGEVASMMTPVPGGVGPMTVAMLLSNVVKASLLAQKA